MEFQPNEVLNLPGRHGLPGTSNNHDKPGPSSLGEVEGRVAKKWGPWPSKVPEDSTGLTAAPERL